MVIQGFEHEAVKKISPRNKQEFNFMKSLSGTRRHKVDSIYLL